MRVLIAGFGSVGRRHFRNLQALGVRDVCFLRTSLGTLDAEEIGGCSVFRDMDQAFESAPDAVIVATPTSSHVPVAISAVRAGFDVFVEKPLSDSMAACDDLIKESEARPLITMVGCQYRFHPLLRQLRRQLHDRAFGEPLSAHAEYGDNLRHWHPWEDHRQSYSARAALGGGAILTLIHPLDYLYWLFGAVRNVHASVRRVPELETDVPDDMADITMEFETGVIGHAHVDFVQAPPEHMLTVICERGRALLDFHRGTLHWQSAREADPIVTRVVESFDRNAMFIDELTHFLECLGTRRSTDVPFRDGRAVLEIALKARDDATRRQAAVSERAST